MLGNWIPARHAVLLVLGMLLPVALAAPATAQTVRGYVIERDSERPVAAARVVAMDSTGTVRGSTESGRDGTFLLEMAEPGSYTVAVQRLGYRSRTDGPFELARDEVAGAAFYLEIQPLPVDEILAEVDREETNRYLEEEGFYHRAKAYAGQSLGPEEIREMGAFNFSDLARAIPFARYQSTFAGQGGLVLVSRQSGTSYCSPTIFIDGFRQFGGLDLDTYLTPDEVLGIEVYRGPQVPLEWDETGPRLGMGGCGVVLIWSRWGR